MNSTDSEDGCTPLHLACRKGDMACLQELLECHARVDITDRKGETVFHYAVRGSNPYIIEVGAVSKLGEGGLELFYAARERERERGDDSQGLQCGEMNGSYLCCSIMGTSQPGFSPFLPPYLLVQFFISRFRVPPFSGPEL